MWSDKSLWRFQGPGPLAIILAVLAVTVALSFILPAYLPVRTTYVVLLCLVAWTGGKWWGLGAAMCTLASLIYQDATTSPAAEVEPNVDPWQIVSGNAFRVVLYISALVGVCYLRVVTRQLHAASRTDALTQVGNRRAFDDTMELELARAYRYRHPLSMAILDINKFKVFNDKVGHMAGDNLLQQIGQSLRDNLRSTDFVARIGGDEFAVLLPETRKIPAESVMDKIREQVGEFYTPGISVGVTEWAMPSAERMLAGSDEAMYEQKRATSDDNSEQA